MAVRNLRAPMAALCPVGRTMEHAGSCLLRIEVVPDDQVGLEILASESGR